VIIFDAILNRAPAMRLNSSLPAELDRIIGKCLEKDRNLRCRHASEIHADLQRLKRDTASARVTVGARPATGIAKPRKRIVAGAAAVLALAGAGYLYLHRGKDLLPGIPRAPERSRSGHPDPHAGQGRMRPPSVIGRIRVSWP
jgi:hypothetical protein